MLPNEPTTNFYQVNDPNYVQPEVIITTTTSGFIPVKKPFKKRSYKTELKDLEKKYASMIKITVMASTVAIVSVTILAWYAIFNLFTK